MLLAYKNRVHDKSNRLQTSVAKAPLRCLSIRMSQLIAVSLFMTWVVSLHLLANSPVHGNDDVLLSSAAQQKPRIISPATSIVQSKTSAYEKMLARIDTQLNAKKSFVATRPDSVLHLTSVAEVYFERARLSGEFNDYADALDTLEQVFEMPDRGNGPVLLRARLNYSLHRLPSIESDLQTAESALLVNKPTVAMIEGIRADVMLQQGRYADARRAFTELDNSNPDSTSAIRIAQANVYIGDYEEAEHWFGLAQAQAPHRSAHLRSWLALQQGILDFEQGRLDEALVHYQHALNLFPGYWLVEEHIAEIDALQGRTDIAERAYRDLIKRTDSPQFMIALADILIQGTEQEKNEANRLLEEANRVYTTMAEKIPEAIAGHALEYFLHQGNPKQSLQLAMDNYQLRAGGPPAVLLAQAHAVNGHLSEASTILDKLLKSPFRSADLHATAGVVYRALGFDDRADHQEQLAVAMNPGSVADSDWLRHGIKAIDK